MWPRSLQAVRHCEHGGHRNLPTVLGVFVVIQCQLACLNASHAGPLYDQMAVRRRENANIHDNSPGRRKSLVPTAAVDSLEACVFMLNRISLCILSKLDPSRSGRPSESLVNVIQYRRCGL